MFVRLLFALFVVCSIIFSFALGYQTRRWTEPNIAWDQPTSDQHEALGKHVIRQAQRIKEDEYVVLRQAVKRHRQHAIIDDRLLVMRECRSERAKQRPVVLHIAEGK